MPFTSWVIRPTSSCTALLTLKTPMLDILLNIGDGWCQLLEPQIAECKDIQAQKLPPKVLLQVIKFPLTSINECPILIHIVMYYHVRNPKPYVAKFELDNIITHPPI